jgi:hypothetical protein
MHIFFDLSRLLWRAERFAPTGIDRPVWRDAVLDYASFDPPASPAGPANQLACPELGAAFPSSPTADRFLPV